MARKLRVFAWFNFLTPSPFLPFHSFPSHRVFLRHITVHRSLTLPNPNSFSPPYSTLVFIPLLSLFLPLPIFSSYSLNPRPGTSLLRWSHSLPPSFTPPTDLPLSSSTFFPFPLHPSPSHPSPHILRSPPFAPHAPPIPLLPFTTPCLPPPTDLPLSYFTLFRFPYSPLILHSPSFTPYTPPTDLPLSSFTLFPFLLHHSPFHRSHHILRSHLFTPYTPPIPLPPLTTPCPSSSYRPSPIFLHSFSFPPPSFSFLPLSSYSPFLSLHTLHPSHFPPLFHYLMSFLLLQTIPSLVSFPFLPLPCHAPSGHQCLIFLVPSLSALFLPEYNCVTITVKLTRFSIKLLSGFIIEQEEQAKQSLCESLHNKLLSVQSALKVCVWLSIVFFSYQFPSLPNNNNLADRAYTYQRIISVEKRDW